MGSPGCHPTMWYGFLPGQTPPVQPECGMPGGSQFSGPWGRGTGRTGHCLQPSRARGLRARAVRVPWLLSSSTPPLPSGRCALLSRLRMTGLEEGPLVSVTQHSVIGNGRPGQVDRASRHGVPGHRARWQRGSFPGNCPAVREGAGDKAPGPERPGPLGIGAPTRSKGRPEQARPSGPAEAAGSLWPRRGRLSEPVTLHLPSRPPGLWVCSPHSSRPFSSCSASGRSSHPPTVGWTRDCALHLPALSSDTKVALPSRKGTGLTAGHPRPHGREARPLENHLLL